MATQHQLTLPVEGISCHAWNADRTMVAISPNNNEIHIYGSCNTPNWKRLFVLTEHDLLVSSVDWSSVNNKIVSCSHDRNAFVWTFIPAHGDEPAVWKPALVILRIDRAAIDVKWSLDGLRFAVTSGAKCVPVCTYEPENDWWISKMIKKAKSTVLCCAFHPTNGQLLATGSSDFKCRVFSTYCSEVDGSEDAGLFGAPVKFGETYAEYSVLGWVNAVAWSPSGHMLAFAGQDSSVHIASFTSGGASSVQVIRFRDLPLCKLLFLSEVALVGAGHDFNPFLFTSAQGQFSFQTRLDVKEEENTANSPSNSGVAAARAMFQNKAVRGQEKKQDTDTLWTQHENTITGLSAMTSNNKGHITKFSTTSVDGRLVVWDMNGLTSSVHGLNLAALQL